jgi:glycerol kinase
MTANALLMQFQADVLDADVVRSTIAETTCLGAAYAAGLAVGFWPDLATLRSHWREDAHWMSSMSAETRDRERANWDKAVLRSLDWEEGRSN